MVWPYSEQKQAQSEFYSRNEEDEFPKALITQAPQTITAFENLIRDSPESLLTAHTVAHLLSLHGKPLAWEKLAPHSLFEQSYGAQVGNSLTLDDAQDCAMGDSSSPAYLPDADVQVLHGCDESNSEQTGVLGGKISGEVSRQPIGSFTGDLGGTNSSLLDHAPTLSDVDARPPVPHTLVGAPADRQKAVGQHACQNDQARANIGRYIDHLNLPMGADTITTQKPLTGILLSDAVDSVLAHWKRTKTLTEKTICKFEQELRRYVKYTNYNGPTLLADQTEELATQWIKSRGENRQGVIETPTPAAQGNRRLALRKFYRDAEMLKLSESGLVVRTYIPPRTPNIARPLTEAEARNVWSFANDAGPHRRTPVMIALLLSGVHSSEVGLLTVGDFDRANHKIWVHGETSRLKPRWVSLVEPMLTTVVERVDYLTNTVRTSNPLESYQLTQGNSSRPMGYSQNRAASACKEVFFKAGLGSDSRITPTSISLYAGLRMLLEGARIEEITCVLGYSSLDTCAKALGYDWETGELF